MLLFRERRSPQTWGILSKTDEISVSAKWQSARAVEYLVERRLLFPWMNGHEKATTFSFRTEFDPIRDLILISVKKLTCKNRLSSKSIKGTQ